MSDFSEKLQRSLDAADYLIQAANTGDPALRERLTSIAYDLLGDADNLPPGDPVLWPTIRPRTGAGAS